MATKDGEKSARQGYAHKAAHLRSEKFGVPGFKSNERIPPLSKCMEMAEQRRRTMGGRMVVDEIRTPRLQ